MDRTVLVVCSNPAQVQQLASMLTPLDLRLESADSVERARSLLRDLMPGVVLADAKLPDGDWHSVLLAVREIAAQTQVLVTHAYADAHFWTDALEAGAYDIITQPLHAAEVQRLTISAWLKYESERGAIPRMDRPMKAAAVAAQAAS